MADNLEEYRDEDYISGDTLALLADMSRAGTLPAQELANVAMKSFMEMSEKKHGDDNLKFLVEISKAGDFTRIAEAQSEILHKNGIDIEPRHIEMAFVNEVKAMHQNGELAEPGDRLSEQDEQQLLDQCEQIRRLADLEAKNAKRRILKSQGSQVAGQGVSSGLGVLQAGESENAVRIAMEMIKVSFSMAFSVYRLHNNIVRDIKQTRDKADAAINERTKAANAPAPEAAPKPEPGPGGRFSR